MTKAIFIIKRMWNTFWVCLTRSAESATEATSLALHSDSHALKKDPSLKRGKLSQWLYWEKNLLERSTGHILNVSVNANSFRVQCSVRDGGSCLDHQEIEFYIIVHAD